MNILVTGGAGFIGSHLCERLLALKHKVICFDNFNDFYSPQVKRDNLKSIKENQDFVLCEGDLRNLNDLNSCFADKDIEVVIHLAAMAGVRPSFANPDLYWHVNFNGTINLMNVSRDNSVGKFIFASSSSVYGNREGGVFKESDIIEKPVSPYAESKKAIEQSLSLWANIWDAQLIILRFFTCYGPRQRPDLAIHKFTRLIYEGKAIPVFGDGSTSRDYTYIDDTIDGIVKAVDYQNTSKEPQIFNLGESKTIKLIDMIKTLEQLSGRTAILDRQPMQQGDVVYTCADITKSREVLGYEPQVSFEAGMCLFIDWFEKNRSSYITPN